MSDCYSTAYVQTTGWQAGGLVGSIDNATIDKVTSQVYLSVTGIEPVALQV